MRSAIKALFPRYPTKQAVTLPALHIINERLGYVPPQAVVELAELLELSPAQVQDTLSFYGFFKQDKPMGPTRIWFCRSLSCAACGGEELLRLYWQQTRHQTRRNNARRPDHARLFRMPGRVRPRRRR